MSKTAEFPMAKAKSIVQDLFEPNAWIYWTDFLLNNLIGWGAFVLAVQTPIFSFFEPIWFLLSVFCLYRAVIFIHELTHLKKGTFRSFHVVWNILCGFPLMVPSMLYMGVHIDHHKQKFYGTQNDKEYSPFGLQKPYHIVLFLVTMGIAPLVFLVRFLVLTPLSYLMPPLRKPLWEYASSLAVSHTYKRPEPTHIERTIWHLQEFSTFLYVGIGAFLVFKGLVPLKAVVLWYLLAATILFVNGLRTLVAHCYRNPSNHEMTFTEQFLDSIDIPGNLFTALWAPVGLRYHATHHLFPGMPYHHLTEAHRRLIEELPENGVYSKVVRKSLGNALVDLWVYAAKNSKNRSVAS